MNLRDRPPENGGGQGRGQRGLGNDYPHSRMKSAARVIAVWWKALALALAMGFEIALFTAYLLAQLGTDEAGQQTLPVAQLLLPGSAMCAGYLFFGWWLGRGDWARWRKLRRAGKDAEAWRRLGRGYFAGCCAIAALFYLVSFYAGSAWWIDLFGGGAAVLAGGVGGLGAAGVVDFLAAAVGGFVGMVPGILVMIAERALVDALRARREQKTDAREGAAYDAAAAIAGEERAAELALRWLNANEALAIGRVTGQAVAAVSAQEKRGRDSRRARLMHAIFSPRKTRIERERAQAELDGQRKEPSYHDDDQS